MALIVSIWGILVALLSLLGVISFQINSLSSRIRVSVCRRMKTSMAMVMEEQVSEKTSGSGLPTPKVPASAWKWPPVWPFPEDSLDAQPGAESNIQQGGYTASQKDRFSQHIKTFTNEGARILEVSSGESQGVIETPDRIRFDDGAVGGNDPLAPLLQFHKPQFPQKSATFDVVVLTDGIESLTNPRDVFREIWRVLKPGGKCLVCFSTKPSKLPTRTSPVKMWTTMTDEQKIWIVGSYFQYSAGPGWKMIEGYDAGGEGGELEFNNDDAVEKAFVVQAEKIPRSLDPSPFEDISFLLLPAKSMGNEDREYSALRLAADYKAAKDEAGREAVMRSAESLPQIYEVLEKVQDKVVPKPAKALLANYLVHSWTNSVTQIGALRKGLGLDPPNDFWRDVGACTSMLAPNAKITFLGEVISQADRNDKFSGLPAMMKSALEVMQAKLPDEEEQTRLQALVAALAISDYLMTDLEAGAAASRVRRYLESLSTAQVKSMLPKDEEKKAR